ncbi:MULTISPECIES: diacylglycerol/polyprenol kinase family protein [Exiguobacterium]|uniref:diacylglycerol/polyprenol kinase family protein n=1 Tax=Exiguobacterium TaxID=33986 RepID=UPI00103FF782|nr:MULTISPECIES: phosphatidate cytidylyltransferase [Exiguobacterium]MCT4792948.1 phosphatidate cytidylyltransferase [Exiguobacterium artemiae]MDX1260252.1 phosphatidate cytidylyltransferase [Exiguobacterium sp. K1]QNR19504.1 phosphatidate cytidylyltransferase [Exiguobacterium sp. Helios]
MEWIAAVGTIVIVGIVLALLEWTGKKLQMQPETIRKWIHIAVGHWVFLALAWMEHWYVAITPLLFFTLINWITLKRGTGRMNQVERVSYGTVYYPMALALLVLFFFEQEPMALVAGSMVLAWGDGLAALVGKRFGKTFYTRGKIRRSFEGSIAMFLASFLVLTVTFLLYEEPAWLAVSYGFLLANIAALIEAVSYRDTDNLLIPLTIGALVAFAL